MHILIINYEYPPVGGGAGNASRFLARALAKQGHRITVITSAFDKYHGLQVEDSIHVHRITAMRTSVDRANIWQMLCFVGHALFFTPTIVKTERVDVVIAFFTLPSGLISYWIRVWQNLPYVISLRGGDVPYIDPSLNLIHRVIGKLRRQILSSADSIIANSQGLADLSTTTDLFPVTVIPNGVDSELFCPLESKPDRDPNDKLQILFVGRLQIQKNLLLLLQVLANLQDKGVDSFVLHVAGSGPLESLMHKREKELGLSTSIVWHGWLQKPELINLYQKADCFVAPSLFEGLPNAVLEAMACSLPVVASHIPGHDVLVSHDQTGILFDLEKPQQLEQALTRLMEDRHLALRLGSKGRQRVIHNYSWDAAASAYLKVLDKTTERST